MTKSEGERLSVVETDVKWIKSKVGDHDEKLDRILETQIAALTISTALRYLVPFAALAVSVIALLRSA